MLLFAFALLLTLAIGSPENCTHCGFVPPLGGSSTCCADCFRQNPKGACVPSCGMKCHNDTQCGLDLWSPCSSCVNGVCLSNADFSNCVVQEPLVGGPRAPVLPSWWNATFAFHDFVTHKQGRGFTAYDARFGKLQD
jgi:hypothetical protein